MIVVFGKILGILLMFAGLVLGFHDIFREIRNARRPYVDQGFMLAIVFPLILSGFLLFIF